MKIEICDVAPRDGLQNEPEILLPSVRAQLVEQLATTGLPRIEVASFVRDDLVPQMAGAETVVEALDPHEGVTFAGLVLNTRGYERLRETALREVHVSFAASETFQQRNAGGSIEQALAAVATIVAAAHSDGRRVSVTLSTAFGCPFEGRVDEQRVLGLLAQVVAAGADEILVADTIGVAVPTQVRSVVEQAGVLGPPVGVHLHDTRNTAIACAWAAVEAGATIFDASAGGIGGCPFAPRSTGNVATEDLVYLLEREGVDTGVDLEKLIAVAAWLEGVLGRTLPGRVYRAGS
jgi:hydroxymethylglutaryl-CoA lyase/(R)-citramalyl-CoA lyase